MSRESLRAFMNAPTPDDPLLVAEGFVSSPRFAGCLTRQGTKGDYVVFRPGDCRSGKYEMSVRGNGSSTEFPPTTARGIVRQFRKHEVNKPGPRPSND
ncbi:MAG: hypothetical protein ACYDDA_15725 [Acidiferrobacteraceae bacterium]